MAGGATDLGLAFLRLTGVALASHGYQKVFGGNMEGFTQVVERLGFPVPFAFAWAAAASELAGGALVAVGLFARPAAGFAAVTMFVAAFLQHNTDPFSKREPALLYLVAMLALACLGPGRWSLEAVIPSGSKSSK